MNWHKLFGLCLTAGGLALVWYAANWLVALAMFLLVWGNNIEQSD